MRDRDALLLLLLLLVVGRSPTSGPPALPEPSPGVLPGVRSLEPGVYWFCATANEAELLVSWFRDNAESARLVKMLGTNGGDCAIVLLEVRQRVMWTLDGMPQLAPNGLDTTLEDLRSDGKLSEFFRRMAERTWEQIKRFDQAVQQWMQQHLPAPPSW